MDSDDSDNGLKGTPYCQIRNENSLFYSYNPRGVEGKKKLPNDYCQFCQCPRQYCANTVFGKVCADDVEFLLYRNCHNGPIDSTHGAGLKEHFQSAYMRLGEVEKEEERQTELLFNGELDASSEELEALKNSLISHDPDEVICEEHNV